MSLLRYAASSAIFALGGLLVLIGVAMMMYGTPGQAMPVGALGIFPALLGALLLFIGWLLWP